MENVQQLQAEMMPQAKVMPGTMSVCLLKFYCRNFNNHQPSWFQILGINKLIDHLVKQKVPIAVATGNSEYEFGLKLKGHSEFFKNFQHKVRNLRGV